MCLDILDEMRRSIAHAPRSTRKADSTALAAVRHEVLGAAVTALHATETVRQDPAVEEVVELLVDVAEKAGAPWARRGEGPAQAVDLGGHQTVQQRPFGFAAAIQRAAGGRGDGGARGGGQRQTRGTVDASCRCSAVPPQGRCLPLLPLLAIIGLP